MRVRAAVGVLVALLLGIPATARPAQAATPPGALRDRVLHALGGSTADATAVAVAADGLGPVVDIAGNVALPPASTQKLYTGGAALRQLGPGYRYHTSVRATAPPLVDGTLL